MPHSYQSQNGNVLIHSPYSQSLQPNPSSSYQHASYDAMRAISRPQTASYPSFDSQNGLPSAFINYSSRPSSPASLQAALNNLNRISRSHSPTPVYLPNHSTSPEAYSLAARSSLIPPPVNAPATGYPAAAQTVPPAISSNSAQPLSVNHQLGLGIITNQALHDLPQAMQETVLHTPVTSPHPGSTPFFDRFQDRHSPTTAAFPQPQHNHVQRSGPGPGPAPTAADHVPPKLVAAYNMMESALADMKPDLVYNQYAAHPDGQKVAELQRTMSDFKDTFLETDISVEPRSKPPSPVLTKGDKKRMLQDADSQALPPPKRAESAQARVRKLSNAVRPSMPSINHTHSSPAVPSQSQFAGGPPMQQYVGSGLVSSTPVADATVAGMHFPLGALPSPPAPLRTSESAISPHPAMTLPPLHLPPRTLHQEALLHSNLALNPADRLLYSAPVESHFMETDSSHSQPETPPIGQHISGYFDPSLVASANMYDASLLRQASNPRMYATHSINTSATVSPSDASSSRGGYHTPAKSWAYSNPNTPVESAHFGEIGVKSRPRSSTVGAFAAIREDPPESNGFPESEQPHLGNSTVEAISPDLREHMDAMFVDWLQGLCNDLDATDSKGEPIHQTLMAKKMQKLDDSGEFRPFRFRIQAFTNRFAEELVMRGIRESDLPHKYIRLYLWNQPLISRFNEEGKKAKSKGNHVWSIDARKIGEGRWSFRPFQRRIVCPAAKTVREGTHWFWDARIWDPQIQTIRANFSSPNLPSWLSWGKSAITDTISELSGTAPMLPVLRPADDESTFITVYATFDLHGQVQQLEAEFELTVTATPTATAAGMPSSMRSSVAAQAARATVNAAPLPMQNIHEAVLPGSTTMDRPIPPLHIPSPDQQQPIQSIGVSPSSLAPPVPLAPPVSAPTNTIEAIISPVNLLAAEQRALGETGPLATALIQREQVINALHTLPQDTHPEVVSSLQQQAEMADMKVSEAVSDAQTTALQSFFGTDAVAMPPSSFS